MAISTLIKQLFSSFRSTPRPVSFPKYLTTLSISARLSLVSAPTRLLPQISHCLPSPKFPSINLNSLIQVSHFSKNSNNNRPKGPSKPKSMEKKARKGKFVCWHCKEAFDGAKPLKKHYEIKHPGILAMKKRIDCNCGNSFPEGEGFHEHLETCPRPPGKKTLEAYADLIQDYRNSRKETKEMKKDNRGGNADNGMNHASVDNSGDALGKDDGMNHGGA